MIRGTSFAAERAIKPKARQLRAKVFLFILSRGALGATLEEIEQGLKLPGNTVRPRRVELEEKGFVKGSGKTRPTASGRSAIVWIVPEEVASKARMKLASKGA
jgi:hypothetical protein